MADNDSMTIRIGVESIKTCGILRLAPYTDSDSIDDEDRVVTK